ncbi:MAG: energy transducer TonB, partial [Acidobacteriaceae bacterium]
VPEAAPAPEASPVQEVTSAEPAQPPRKVPTAVKPQGGDLHSKSPFLLRSLACIFILCAAPVSGIQLHRIISAHPVAAQLPSTAESPNLTSAIPALSPVVASTSSEAVITQEHPQTDNPLVDLLKSRHGRMPVDLTLATFAPEPLLNTLPLQPMSESREFRLTRDERSGAASLHTGAARPIPQPSRATLGYVPPKPIWQPAPTYQPVRSRSHRLEDVQLMLSVSSGGDVYRTDVLKGSPKLALAAEKTVEMWKYSPAMSNGVPVNSQVYVTIQFQQP